jgi:N-acetylglucosamine malate deacetylase 2
MNWQADSKKSAQNVLEHLCADPPDSSLRLAILAAHPDDETIGASALLSKFPNAAVVFLTDGAPRDTKLWPPELDKTREEYRELRHREAVKALSHAGIGEKQIHWLGAIDQDAIFNAQDLTSRFAEWLRKLRLNLLITHPYEGGHPDHDCAALISRLAITMLSREVSNLQAPGLLEMTSYHARDEQCATGEFLNSDPGSEIVFELTEEDRQRKRKMMDEYQSQRLILENFPIAAERLRVAPVHDFSRPPHDGKLWYECIKWPMTGERWRELAACASEQQECSCG